MGESALKVVVGDGEFVLDKPGTFFKHVKVFGE